MNKKPSLTAMKEKLHKNSNDENDQTILSKRDNTIRPRSGFNHIAIDKPAHDRTLLKNPPARPRNSLRTSSLKITQDNSPLLNIEPPKRNTPFDSSIAFSKEETLEVNETNFDTDIIEKQNKELKKELENLKLSFYQMISLKYENINVLNPDGNKLSDEFLDYLNNLQNQTYSDEFNHLQAELLEYQYNLKLKEQTESILKEEINNLQNFYSAEQLKARSLEQALEEIQTEITELVKAYEDIKEVQLAENKALKQRIQKLTQYHQETLKANEEAFRSFLNQFHDQLELKVKEYEDKNSLLQIELRKSQDLITNRKREIEHLYSLLESLERENIFLKHQLGMPVDYSILYRSKSFLFPSLYEIDDVKSNMNEQLKHLDYSINSLYNKNDGSQNRPTSVLELEFKELSNKVNLLLDLYQTIENKQFSSLNNSDIKPIKKLNINNDLFDEFLKFKNNVDLKSLPSTSQDKTIKEIFRSNDIDAIEKMNLDYNVKAKALSICTIKKVINERSKQKIEEHEKDLKELNLKKDNLDEKVKSIKYSIFEIEHVPSLRKTLSTPEQEQRKLELYYELDIRQSEFNDLIEEEQRIKRNHLTYLQERDAQLARVGKEEEKLIKYITSR